MVIIPEEGAARDEGRLAQVLAEARWGDAEGVLRCPGGCGGRLWRVRKRPRTFGCSRCRRTHNVTADCLLHGAKLPLWKIFAIAMSLAKPDRPSARALARALGIHVETAWRWRHRLLAAVASLPASTTGSLGVAARRVPVQRPHRHTPAPADELVPSIRRRLHRGRRELVSVVGRWSDTLWLCHVGFDLRQHLKETTCTDYEPLLMSGLRSDPAISLLDEIEHQVRRVLFGVSARWLPHYAQFAAKRRHFGLDDAISLLGAAFRAPHLVFDALRPGTTRALDEAIMLRAHHVRTV